jgi:hypothetical protein
MKKLLVFSMVLVSFVSYGQEKTETFKTKTDVFLSKTGAIIKYVDYSQPNLVSKYSSCETRVRKITNATDVPLIVYQIVKEGKYGSSTASIDYIDLIEILKAIKTLKNDVVTDVSSSNYIENKFVSTDGFQLGYYISGGKSVWYIQLEKYGSDKTVFIDNVDTIETAMNNAKIKMDEIKK